MAMRSHIASRAAATTAADAEGAQEEEEEEEEEGLRRKEDERHVQALVVQLADWAAAETMTMAVAAAVQSSEAGEGSSGSGAKPALQLLCELPWAPGSEERALLGWLVSQLGAGKPAGDLLPLYFLGRGRVPEAVGAYNKWQLAKQQQPGGAEGTAAAAGALVDAMVNAAAGLLPLPQRNVCIAPPATNSGEGNGDDGPLLPPARLLQGLVLQADANVPVMHASVTADGRSPPFMGSLMPAQPKKAEAATASSSAGASYPHRLLGGVAAPASSSGLALMPPGGYGGGDGSERGRYMQRGGQLLGLGLSGPPGGVWGGVDGPAFSEAAPPPPLETYGLPAGSRPGGLFSLSAGGPHLQSGEGLFHGGRGEATAAAVDITLFGGAPDPKRAKTNVWGR